MKTTTNFNGTKTHVYEDGDKLPDAAELTAMVGGGMPCFTTLARHDDSRLFPPGSTLVANDMGHMIGPPQFIINTYATEIYHSTCVKGAEAFIVGDAVVLPPEPMDDY